MVKYMNTELVISLKMVSVFFESPCGARNNPCGSGSYLRDCVMTFNNCVSELRNWTNDE